MCDNTVFVLYSQVISINYKFDEKQIKPGVIVLLQSSCFSRFTADTWEREANKNVFIVKPFHSITCYLCDVTGAQVAQS